MAHWRHPLMPFGGWEHETADDVEEAFSLKRAPAVEPWLCVPQCGQLSHGSAVSALPVSMMRSNLRGGEPTHTVAEK